MGKMYSKATFTISKDNTVQEVEAKAMAAVAALTYHIQTGHHLVTDEQV